ncbi:PDDEXK nuclease domain-containing protein [Chryseobacterium sp. Leaf201]|uniref:PDDEXK nuclease domain-containing protein n=1 Tax=Chryseobacterium sp. Leaf201 TaxID=1735672 RepID=UPI000A6CC861|nr:PDDEXK nuclease domain-containing protein [Chryseobacterium sp. Leaf201]
MARNEKQPSEAKEIIKDPMILEFLGLKRENSYYEKDLESAIITHLQDFVGVRKWLFIRSKTKKIHLAGDEFFVDLVFSFGMIAIKLIILPEIYRLPIVKENQSTLSG